MNSIIYYISWNFFLVCLCKNQKIKRVRRWSLQWLPFCFSFLSPFFIILFRFNPREDFPHRPTNIDPEWNNRRIFVSCVQVTRKWFRREIGPTVPSICKPLKGLTPGLNTRPWIVLKPDRVLRYVSGTWKKMKASSFSFQIL